MAAPLAYPLVNGVRHSFVSTEVKFAKPAVGSTQAGTALSLNLRGYKEITYSRSRSRTMMYGNHPDPISKTRGKSEYKCTAIYYLAEFNAIQSAIQALGPAWGEVFFEMVVTYSENGFDTITDTISGCTMDVVEATNTEGTEPTERKLEFNPLKVLLNGIEDASPALQGGNQ